MALITNFVLLESSNLHRPSTYPLPKITCISSMSLAFSHTSSIAKSPANAPTIPELDPYCFAATPVLELVAAAAVPVADEAAVEAADGVPVDKAAITPP